MGSEEPVQRLSEVLTNLQDLSEQDGPVPKQSWDRQVATLLEVQEQMMVQLRLHDAQIAALREVIALLSGKSV